MKSLKFKALFEIFLVLSLTFIISLSFNSRNVYADSSEEGFACCMNPKDNSGPCQNIAPENCNDSPLNPTTCENFAPCQAGCCDMTNVPSYLDKSCKSSVSKNYCEQTLGGIFRDDSTCNSYSQCKSGCCVFGSNCQLTTESGCEQLTSYTDLEMNFDTNIHNEFECLSVCANQEKGCCVKDNEYKYITGNECLGINGEFFNDLCSNVLGSPCEANDHLSCVTGSDDVYSFDSCGNVESVSEDCDYSVGERCGEKPDGSIGCVDINCANIWNNPVVDEDGSCGDNALPGHECYNDEGVNRLNGESWCQYDSNAGPTLDLPGTRHYVHYCLNGKEEVNECGDYRDEICVQAKDTNGRLNAGCIDNSNAVECSKQSDKTNCEGSGTCVWLSTGDNIKEKNPEISDIDFSGEGKCIPFVPLGRKLLNVDETNSEGDNEDELCKAGSFNVETQWKWTPFDAQWDCEVGCDAFSNTFLKNSNSLCSAYGDCGAKYNLAGYWGKDGFERSDDTNEFRDNGLDDLFGENGKDSGDIHGISIKDNDGNIKDEIGENGKWAENKFNYENGDDKAYDFYMNSENRPLDPDNFNEVKFYKGLLTLEDINLQDFGLGNEWAETLSSLGIVGVSAALLYIASTSGGFIVISTGLASATTTLSIPVIGEIIFVVALVVAAVASILFAIEGIGSKEESINVNFECNPWQPPTNPSEQRCELCYQAGEDNYGNIVDFTAEGRHECTEYLCESLGSSCEFKSTIDGGRCFNSCDPRQNPEALQLPFAAVNNEFKEQQVGKQMCNSGESETSTDKDCEFENDYGVQGSGENILQYYRPNSNLDLSFSTCGDAQCENKVYAECRWSTSLGENFDSKHSFDEAGFSTKHSLTLNAGSQLKAGEEFNLYIQCRNRCGNPNTEDQEVLPDYKITIKSANEPDKTAPNLISSEPMDNGFIKNESLLIRKEDTARFLNLQKLKLKFEEGIFKCRYDKLNLAYGEMANSVSCGSQPECEILLFNMKEGENNLYVKCEDLAGDENPDDSLRIKGNINTQSLPDNDGFKFTGTNKLEIEGVKCLYQLGSATIDSCDEIFSKNFILEVDTKNGAQEGKARCGFSATTPFKETSENEFTVNVHRQPIENRVKGNGEKLNVYCEDAAGNTANKEVLFNIMVDEDKPLINRVYKEGDFLVVETNEKANCRYINSQNTNLEEYTEFDITDDVEHKTGIGDNNFFNINCEDIFENSMSASIFVNK